jgi:hypothetical protein
MRRSFLVLALLVVSVSGAFAACREDVLAAYEKQRSAGQLRMQTSMVSEQGPISMTVDYILPDRMHQRVTNKLTQQTRETILVGPRAWVSDDGKTWKELSVEQAAEVAEGVRESIGAPPTEFVTFDCLGRTKLDGKEYIGYSVDEAKGRQIPGQPVKDPPVRILFVDPETGLPARTIVAVPDRIEKPFFRADYSYPQDLRIEPPVSRAD